jgi:hypothetical protein
MLPPIGRQHGELFMDASSKIAPAGQASALWMSTIAFTACFAVGTIFSIIGIQIQKQLGVCTENLILIDYVTESPNVNGDDRAALLVPDPVRLAVQVEEPT